MEKSIFSTEYGEFVRRLRIARKRAKVTQAQLASLLGASQSFVSKYERGERRIDVIELGHICAALGVRVTDFVDALVDEQMRGDPSCR
jgi:transcriptional regulator with XRE-family HTH domain